MNTMPLRIAADIAARWQKHGEWPGPEVMAAMRVLIDHARATPEPTAADGAQEGVRDDERGVYARGIETAIHERDEAAGQRDELIEALRDALGDRDPEWFPDGFPDHLAAVEAIRWMATRLAGNQRLVPSRWDAPVPPPASGEAAGDLAALADKLDTVDRALRAIPLTVFGDEVTGIARALRAHRCAPAGPEIVTGAEAAELPDGSLVNLVMTNTSTPITESALRWRTAKGWVNETGAKHLLTDECSYAVLHRPRPNAEPAQPLAVGDIVTTAAEFGRLPETARIVRCDEDGRPRVGCVVSLRNYLGEPEVAADDMPFLVLDLGGGA